MKNYYVYIMASINKNLYIGVTSNLIQRVIQHKNKTFGGFTSKYQINKLVYFETFSNINEAITSEKKLKNWHRDWKINLVEKNNPNWIDLSLIDPEINLGGQKKCHCELVSESFEKINFKFKIDPEKNLGG